TVDGLGPDSSDDDGTFDLTGDATVDLVDEEVSTTPRISCSSYLAHWLVGQPKQHTYRYTGPNLGPSPAISLEGGPASLGASIVEELDGSYSITVHDVCDQPHYGPVVFKIGGQTLTADVSGDPCVIICDRPLASIKDPPPEHTRYHEIPQSGAVDLKTYHNVTALTGLVPQSYSVEESLGYNLLELQSGAAQQFGIDKLVSIGADGTMTIGALEFPGSLGFTILVQSQVTITISGSVQQVSYSRGTLEIGFAVSDVGNPVGDPVTSNLVGYGGFSIGSTALLVPPQLTSSSTTDLALEIGPADWQGPGAPCPDAGTICWCISYNYQVRFSCIPPAELAITSNECEPGCGQNQVCLKEADGAICRGYDPAQSDPANSVYHLTFNNTTVTAALHDNGFSPTSTPGTVNDPFETNLVDGLSFNTFVLPSASPWCWVWYKYSFYSSAYVSYPCGAPQIGSKAPQYTSIMSFVISGP
ncbi:MAG: hypothetical protein KC609_22045, partial [Myxococcales bacterium]|nr:hypothetical protein [Myxococcales bacterium]